MASADWNRRTLLAGAAMTLLAACTGKTGEQTKSGAAGRTYTVGWTIYAGWMPWPYAQQTGIVKKWADKYGITINLVQINDYVESLNQFTAGKLDAVTSTNMDALTLPAAGGVDTTALIVGDYSNGNDGVLLKGRKSLAEIKGLPVNLVQGSVSQYFLARALESVGLKQSDVKLVNTSDADAVAAWPTGDVKAMATWNPMLREIDAMPDANLVFDSSKIPGEILDMMVVSTERLKENPDFGKALVGIWYEVLELMQGASPAAVAARTAMASLSGTDLAGYDAQLATTYMYYKPADAVAYVNSPAAVTASDRVRKFSFAEGLFGQGAASVDAIGITFPNGVVQGDPNNIKLRFDPSYMAMAAAGTL
ncbi:MAG: ABC transporter substrate-binding protein [Phenylobacterium sp.]|uniref:putative urea ABC transporter substrate-binding protein n=2 Tax=Phenylobacterium sp. TaxID=1871053 RepID=UPI0025F92B2E|nr:putative urea ABC transporter substrate-binding protein [Phenylobacterium sp.]MCA6225177.1 ABC transporter substrate-binding protein [Phenylobacterium sp.]MCA6227932.1 ABC transporter substrate-binding protein [Phenylobacterium sp.]MCA6231770.1 ABC transporter substrate-binding protein [Phenylobacterium sp.]MCA6235782.1 ABC transporter substrate-binding protein [Phenylobacterium sp.]MCA6249697.1 ABC transporter substrate-binding protein [Phenylobacterium sp.]